MCLNSVRHVQRKRLVNIYTFVYVISSKIQFSNVKLDRRLIKNV